MDRLMKANLVRGAYRTMLVSLLLLGFHLQAEAGQYHVALGAAAQGNGSVTNPWQLQVALGQSAVVRPGDTIWVHGGTYVGHFTCTLNGTAASPIIIRNYRGERATLSEPVGAEDILRMAGNYVWVWGLEMMSTGSTTVFFPNGVNFYGGIGNKVINCIIHDALGAGIANLNGAVQTEVYGTLIYYNGRSTGGMGNYNYGSYIQNVASNGQKAMKENVVFYNWSLGVQAYSESSNVDNMLWEGNAFFNNGHFRQGMFERNLLVGGNYTAVNDTLRNNYFYYPSSPTDGARVTLGYTRGSTGLSVTGNYFVRGVFDLNSTNPAITGNTFYGNTYEGYTPADYPSNTYLSAPSGQNVIVRPNAYERGRANIIIYNWSKAASVSVDVSNILNVEDRFIVNDAMSYFGPPAGGGIYNGGMITIRMTGLGPVYPQGPAALPEHTAPEFGVFTLTSGAYVAEVTQTSSQIPNSYVLEQNYPNPFNPATTIEFAIPAAGNTTVKVYTVLGAEVATLSSEFLDAGRYQVRWNAAGWSSGTYIVRMTSGEFVSARKVLLIK